MGVDSTTGMFKAVPSSAVELLVAWNATEASSSVMVAVCVVGAAKVTISGGPARFCKVKLTVSLPSETESSMGVRVLAWVVPSPLPTGKLMAWTPKAL